MPQVLVVDAPRARRPRDSRQDAGAPFHFFADRHPVAFGDAAGRYVLGTDERDQAINVQVRETPFTACYGCFGCEAPSPVVAPEVISDLIQMLVFDMLANDAAVTDHLAGAL